MEEETLYPRIGEADLNPIYKDGQVYQHTDVNNMLSILKTAVNENYYDIQRLENGTKSVGDAKKLDGATLSKALNEPLQSDDNKIPTSQQTKEYVDAIFAKYTSPVRGVSYWTDEDKEEVVDEASDMVLNDVIDDVNREVEKAKEDIENTAFTTFDVIDGKLIASYTIDDRSYDFRLNNNKLEVVVTDE